MPGHSPVVIDSSSPDTEAFRLPSTTPQPHSSKQKPGIGQSSSPGLPSPSTFFVRPTAGLTTGSRAQKVPAGAKQGFTSAAALLKSNYFDGTNGDAEEIAKKAERNGGDSGAGGAEKSGGKLPRPSKPEPAVTARSERSRSITPFDDYAYLAPSPVASRTSKSPALASPIVLNPPADVQSKRRTPSISLSDYEFRPGQQSPSEAVLPAAKVVKKSRRSKPADGSEPGDKPAKKPRKKAAKVVGEKKSDKSASFILNSDDLASTQFAAMEARVVQGERPVEMPPAKTRPKSKKASAKEQATSRPQDQQSAYFTDPADHVTTPHGKKDRLREETSIQAHRRRLSWTPAKNTSAAAEVRPDTPCSKGSVESETPALRLTDMIGKLKYTMIPSVQRSDTGEALTKRRRVELADETTKAAVLRKAELVPPPVAADRKKKEKPPKKRPQTITELATKAYRPDDLPIVPPEQATVSSFFVPEPGPVVSATAPTEVQEPVKIKKPRKSRAKKADVDAATATGKPKKSKTGKAKVRFDEADYLARLYEPEQARAEETRQDFLFGTSSQLGGEDSPTFIRQMQLAVRESENVSAVSPTRKSYMKIASAPYGTSLTAGQGDKEHWCSAARDADGDTLGASYVKRVVEVNTDISDQISIAADLPSRPDGDPEYKAGATTKRAPPELQMITENVDKSTVVMQAEEPTHEIVDLCQSSSPAAAMQVHDEPEQDEPVAGPNEAQHERNTVPPLPHDRNTDLVGVSSSNHATKPRPASPSALMPSLKPNIPTLRRSATSPIRPALQTLDGNIHLMARTSPLKEVGHRAFTTTISSPESKRPRGRPRKENPAAGGTPTPKRRGRPPKQKQAIPEDLCALNLLPTTKSASQPAASSDFVNIDEISDSDSPKTPSPPRRRATSSPPALQQLEFDGVIPAPTILTTKLKPDDPAWSFIAADLFPKITAAIRSTPPSTDMTNPTWHEKILLYDPIVLEDLTAWLNGQGLRLETRKAKPKKRKGGNEVVEYETLRHELVPWMVQKWCEEQSVCCLWKEGLRGGVRTRY